MLQEIINVKSSLLPSWTLSSDESSFSGKRETLYVVLLEEPKTGLHWLSSAGIWQTSFLFNSSLWCLHCPLFQFKLQQSFILRTGWISHGFPFQLWTTCMDTIPMTQLMACKTKTVALTSWRCYLACSGSLTSQSLVCSTKAVAAIKPHISTLHSTECWRAPCSQSQEWSWASLPFSPANLHLPWWSRCPVLHPHNTSDVSMDASPPQLQFPPISQSLLHSTLPNTRQAASRIRE